MITVYSDGFHLVRMAGTTFIVYDAANTLVDFFIMASDTLTRDGLRVVVREWMENHFYVS